MNVHESIKMISRKSLHEELVDRLRDLIVEGVLEPGSKFPEKALCLKYGVSRTPMREALKVLAGDGLIVLEPNRGAWVSQITLAEMSEVFPVLSALEALAGELACELITDAELAEVRSLHEEMRRHYEHDNLKGYFRVNQAIHEAIISAARNTTLAIQHRMLAVRARRARYVANISQERWQQALCEHDEIILALEARDGARLGLHLKQHMRKKFEAIRCRFEEMDSTSRTLPRALSAPSTRHVDRNR
ncbi:MAG: GntR family transcriptional regulator [Rhizobiales bacterium]|nr:GntR family transcriptional regulator [Hyphomicrobiales bacterium]